MSVLNVLNYKIMFKITLQGGTVSFYFIQLPVALLLLL